MKKHFIVLSAVITLASCTSSPLQQNDSEASSSSAENSSAEEQSSVSKTASAHYAMLALPFPAVKNYERNVVYRYTITAPAGQNVILNNQSFGLVGSRWSQPQLSIFSDASLTQEIDTWSSEDNYGNHHETLDDMTTLQGSLIIPGSQTRYLQLTVNVGTPVDGATLRRGRSGR
jgi:hypothetical protein